MKDLVATATPDLLDRLRRIQERRARLSKQLAELDGELMDLLGMPTTTRKPPRQVLDRKAAERLIMGGKSR